MSIPPIVKRVVPPIIYELAIPRSRRVHYRGAFTTWDAAAKRSGGYDEESILEKVAMSARLVRDGMAAFERDGVAFSNPDYVWPVMTALLRSAARNQGRLAVLDFGGSLGSLYFQHRPLLRGLGDIQWAIVEQPRFVEMGKREFQTQELRFFDNIHEAVTTVGPSVALLSAVLPWVPEPYAYLNELISLELDSIVLDRTALTESEMEVVSVQHVPASIYRATYPVWFLSKPKLMRLMSARYDLVAEIPARDPQVGKVEFSGMIFDRRVS